MPPRAKSTLNSTSPRTTQYGVSSNPTTKWLTPFKNRLKILHGGTIASMVDLGGSLAVASMGLYATGVTTDMSSTLRMLSPSNQIGRAS